MNEYLIRLAEAEDIERIQQLSQELIEVLEDNKEAQRFYKKHGLYNYAIEQYAEMQV